MAAFSGASSNSENTNDLLKILQDVTVLNKEHILQAFRNEEVTSLEQLVGWRRTENLSEIYQKLNITTVGEKIAMDEILHDAQRKRIHSLIGQVRRGTSTPKGPLFQTRQSKKRKVMLGWLHWKGNKVVQIRQKDGGGSRSALFSPSDGYDAILDRCRSLFFPNGESSYGKIEDMQTSLARFNREAIQPVKDGVEFSIKGYQEETKLSTLRIFLKTVPKSEDSSGEDEELFDPFQEASVHSDESFTVSFGPAQAEPDVFDLDNTLEELPPPMQQPDVLVQHDVGVPRLRYVEVHRTTIFIDCIHHFKDASIMEDHLKITFINEKGVDGGGVSRDVYSSFWQELFNTSAEGCNEMVPYIRNDMGRQEWASVGRVLGKGFLDHNFFPVGLCKAFILGCLIGPDNVHESTLIKSFVEYISAEDRECLQKALSDMENMTEEENDELLDILSRYHCRTLPRKETISKVVATVAHKELLQKPKYILDCFHQSCASFLKLKGIESEKDLESMYEKLKPSPKKVVKLIKASPTNSMQMNALEFLKKYVRGLDKGMLEKFLHFCTGSTVMCIEKIDIQFTQNAGFSRRPVAHTCGPVLQLPETYDSFPELKGEFNGVLTAGPAVLEMHVV